MRTQLFILLCFIFATGWAWNSVNAFHSYKEYVLEHQNDTFANAGYQFNQSNVAYLKNGYYRDYRFTKVLAYLLTLITVTILWKEIDRKFIGEEQ